MSIRKSRSKEEFYGIPDIDNLTYEEMNIISDFQRLWLQIAVWMRSFFRSSIRNSEDLEAVTARLFEIPTDFYNRFLLYFGEEAAREMYNIVYNLVSTNFALVNAYKSSDQAAIDEATRMWNQGAGEMSAFLANINKIWDESVFRTLMFQYGKLKVEEIIAYLTHDYEKEIRIYNSLEDVAVLIGSYMGRGIIARNLAMRRMPSPDQPQN